MVLFFRAFVLRRGRFLVAAKIVGRCMLVALHYRKLGRLLLMKILVLGTSIGMKADVNRR